MTEDPVVNPFAEARVRARLALRDDAWSSIRVAAWSFPFGTGAIIATCVALLGQQFITRTGFAWIAAMGAVLCGPFVFLCLELRRLHEKAAALRELEARLLQYEQLIQDARNERDDMKERNASLAQQNAALQQLPVLAAAIRAMDGGKDRE